MRTESGMNNMNIESTDRIVRGKNLRRRILASVCAVAIAVLQCAVIVSVGTEGAYAAALNKIEVEYKDGTKATVSISSGDLISYTQETVTVKDDGGNDVVISGPSVGTILEKNNIKNDIKSITIASDGSAAKKTDILVIKIGEESQSSHKVYSGGEKLSDLEDASKTLGVVKKNEPVMYKTMPSMSPEDPKAGDTVTIKYELEVDPFYKSSAAFDEASDTKITWSSSGPIKLDKTWTSGLGEKSITGKTSGEGDIKIIPSSDSFSAGSGEIDTKVQPTTTTTTTEKPTTPTKKTTKKTSQKTSKKTSKHTTKKTSKTTTRRYTTRTGSTYRTYTGRTGTANTTTSTGTTAPPVTYAPDRTITVKEVFIGQQIVDEPQQQPTPADMMEEGWDDMTEDDSTNEWDDTEDYTLDFGPMAGSAAVAVGACGAGVVGRIRKFKLDTATKAVEQITNAKGKK